MNTKPLKGKSVVVTRASHQNAELVRAFSALGADVIAAPAIAIVPPLDGGQPLDDALLRLSRFTWLAFTSSNAVSALMARAARRGGRKTFSFANRRSWADNSCQNVKMKSTATLFPKSGWRCPCGSVSRARSERSSVNSSSFDGQTDCGEA